MVQVGQGCTCWVWGGSQQEAARRMASALALRAINRGASPTAMNSGGQREHGDHPPLLAKGPACAVT